MAEMIKVKVDELLTEINSKPVYTIKELLYGKKNRAKGYKHYWSACKGFSSNIRKKSLICHVIIQKNYAVANAIGGAALAKPTTEINMLVDTAKGIMTVPELEIYQNVDRKFSLELARKKGHRTTQRISKILRGGKRR